MKSRPFLALLSLSLLLGAVSAFAAAPQRALGFSGPTVVRPGADVQIMVNASTDATDGEQIGFLHAEYSTDGGKTWVPVYAEKVGRAATRPINFKAGADGTQALVRARIAFRGGKAGDVDYAGAPIVWEGSWSAWATPPAKVTKITVTTK